MPSRGAHRKRPKRARRFAAVTIGIIVACTWAGQAYAQTPDGPAAVDQYVEDVPTSGGSTIPGKTKPKTTPTKSSLPPRVSNQIASQGGSDAAILHEVATSPEYGAPAATSSTRKPKKKAGGNDTDSGASGYIRPHLEERADIPAPSDSSPSEAVSAAVGAVQGGDAARLVGLLVALFLISAVALTAAGLRNKRRTGTT